MHHPDFPLLIAQLRGDQGWSGRRLARELGVDHATVSRWEGGKTRPSPAFAHRLALLCRAPGPSAPLGEEIRDLRLRAGLSQESYAGRLGIAQSTLSRLEGDLLRPGLELSIRLREVVGPPFDPASLTDASLAECERSYEEYWRACAVYDRSDAVAWASGLCRRLDALAESDPKARRLLARLYGSRAYWTLARGRVRDTERMALAAVRLGVEVGFDLTSGYALWAWARTRFQKHRITDEDRAALRKIRVLAHRHLDPDLPYRELIEAVHERLQGDLQSSDERLDALSERVSGRQEWGQFGYPGERSRWETVQSYRAMFALANGGNQRVVALTESIRCENPIIGLIFEVYGNVAKANLGIPSDDARAILETRAQEAGHGFAYETIIAHARRVAPRRGHASPSS